MIYKGTQIFLRAEMLGLVHTAGTEEHLPMGVDLDEVEAEAKKFGVHVAGDEYEYGLQVKVKTEREVEIAVERIRKFLDYSEENWKVRWW